MPEVTCGNCGGITNTAVAEYDEWEGWGGPPSGCYARWVNGRWVPGCRFDTGQDTLKKQFAQQIIEGETQ